MSTATLRQGPRTWLIGFVALVLVVGLALWGWLLWQNYRAQLVKARNDVGFASWLVEEHMRGAVRGTDIILQIVAQRVEADGIAVVQRPDQEAQLRRLANLLPHLGTVLVFDHAGNLILSTSEAPAPRTIGETQSFKAVAEGGLSFNVAPWVGQPSRNLLVAVSRRLEQRGQFVGVVVGALDLGFFDQFTWSLGLPQGSQVAVYDTSGGLIFQAPTGQPIVAVSHADLPLFTHELPMADKGIYETGNPESGALEINAFRRLTDIPLVVQVSTPKTMVLGDWRQLLWVSGGFALGGLAVTLLLTAAALRSVRLLERANLREAETNASLAAALQQQEMLFREMHHRTKNNLQMIAGLVAMQARREKDPAVRQRLQETIGRVSSMAAIHQQMQGSDNLALVDCSSYLMAVCDSLKLTVDAEHIDLITRLEPVHLPMASGVALGLIVNEAVTNALKHAFPAGRHGRIEVSLQKKGDRVLLSIADDGIGMSSEVAEANTLGLTVIRSMAAKLGATFEWHAKAGAGTTLAVTLSSEASDVGRAAMPQREVS